MSDAKVNVKVVVRCRPMNKTERSLNQPISLPDFVRGVADMMHAVEEYRNEPVPSEKWVGFQFAPQHPTRLGATRFTGRFEMRARRRTRGGGLQGHALSSASAHPPPLLRTQKQKSRC